jgi:hypothetical protein
LFTKHRFGGWIAFLSLSTESSNFVFQFKMGYIISFEHWKWKTFCVQKSWYSPFKKANWLIGEATYRRVYTVVIEQIKTDLLVHDVIPSWSDKVPGDWSTNHVTANSCDDTRTVLFPDLSISYCILQKPKNKICLHNKARWEVWPFYCKHFQK